MRSLFSILLLIFVSSVSYSQSTNPVTWNFDLEQEGEYYVISATAEINEPWVVYSHYTEEGGPIGTTLEIDDAIAGVAKRLELEEEGELINEFSKMFDLDVAKFKKEVTFKQRVKIDPNINQVNGHIRFMTCNGQKCLPPTNIPFSLDVQ